MTKKALTISKIAHLDYPEVWPSFFDELADKLKSSNINEVSGTMRILSDFVRDDLSDLSFPKVAPMLMPELYRLFTDSTVPIKVRTEVVMIIQEFSEIIYMVKEEHPEVLLTYLDPLLNMWVQGLVEILKDCPLENYALKNQVLKTFVRFVRSFPSQTVPIYEEITNLVLSDLYNLKSTYHQHFISPSVDDYEDEDGVDSDGHDYSIPSILYSSLDFLQIICKKKAVRQLILSNIEKIMHTLTLYLQISTILQVQWEIDINQFIQDDEEDSLSLNVRIAVEQCLMVLNYLL